MSAQTYYTIVVNDDGDRGRWPVGRRPPPGWRSSSFRGTRGACERHVAELDVVRPAAAPDDTAQVSERLAALARQQPTAPAFGDMTYAQFDARVDALAAVLRAAGLRPGSRVLVDAAGPGDLAAGLFAALRVRATAVVAPPDEGRVAGAYPRSGRNSLRLDAARGSAHRLARATSGPTAPGGHRPGVIASPPDAPGVLLTQPQLVRLAELAAVPPGARVPHVARLGDPALLVELFGALLAGAALVPGDAAALPAPGWDLPGGVRVRAGGREVVGFLETGLLTVAVDGPVGTPMPGVTVYALDDDLEPVPFGEVGRLHVGGSAVAAGYPDRPDLTVRRFLPDPFAGGGSRMFRTPIFVRQLPDGTWRTGSST